MELIYGDKYYDKEGWEPSKYARELESIFKKIDPEVEVLDTDIGFGASFPSVLVDIFNSVNWKTLLTIVAPGVFLLGKKINENIDAWKEIAKKVKNLIRKHPPTRVDEIVALLYVLEDLGILSEDHEEIDVSIQIIPFTWNPLGENNLSKRSDSLYVITVQVPGKAYVVGIKSNLKIAYTNEYDKSWLKF